MADVNYTTVEPFVLNRTLTLGNAGDGDGIIRTPTSVGLKVFPGDEDSGALGGGAVQIIAGASVAGGGGGNITLQSGSDDSLGSGGAGIIDIKGGIDNGGGRGVVRVTGGLSNSRSGANLVLTGGASNDMSSVGGDVQISGGNGGAGHGYVVLSNLPTTAPATSGAVWRDPVTNALMIVP